MHESKTNVPILSLVIPCFNEEANLPLLLERCLPLGENDHIEVILVNNGSTDNSQDVLDRLLPQYPFCRCVHIQVNNGYGMGILTGLRKAKGNLLAWTHADLQTDPADILKALNIFQNYGPKIYVKGQRVKRPISDQFFTVCMGLFESVLLKSRLWDINAQPNVFSKEFFGTLENPPLDFSLDLYMLFIARKSGLKVIRFPVEFGKRVHGSSSWNINWKAKMKFIRRTIDFSFKLKRRFRH